MPHLLLPHSLPDVFRLSVASEGQVAELGLIHWTTAEPFARLSARARALLGDPGPDHQVDQTALWLGIAPDDRLAVMQAAQAIRPGEQPVSLSVRTCPTAAAPAPARIEISFQAIASTALTWDTYALLKPVQQRPEADRMGPGQRLVDESAGLQVHPMFFREQVQQALRRAARTGGLLAIMSLEVGWRGDPSATADGADCERVSAERERVSELLATRVGRALRAGDVATVVAMPSAIGQPARVSQAAQVSQAADENQTADLGQTTHAAVSVRFSVLLPRIGEPQDAVRVASRLQTLVCEPMACADQWVEPVLFTGIALHPWDDLGPDELLACADHALAGAVLAGDQSPRFFSKPLNALSSDRLTLEATLKSALAAQTFVLRFQPRMDGESRRVVGIETLIRWQHPDRGVIAPGGFIEVAEQSRLIIPIGAWVLEQACRQNRCWQLAGLPAVPVSVNVSAVQFRDPEFVAIVGRALAAGGLAPALLELEITESVAMRDVPDAVRTLRAIKALGVRIAIDDFGTGFSSLAYLRDFPVDVLKIDRSFIHDVATDARSGSIACAVIDMGARLGIAVVAEGVETEAQRRFLLDNGLREMQGYLFARPLSADGLEGFWQSCVSESPAALVAPVSLLDAPLTIQ